tara:strand:- start:191 stop:550 length:360 start_codon:yes stop_codon:yes gene_type:complete
MKPVYSINKDVFFFISPDNLKFEQGDDDIDCILHGVIVEIDIQHKITEDSVSGVFEKYKIEADEKYQLRFGYCHYFRSLKDVFSTKEAAQSRAKEFIKDLLNRRENTDNIHNPALKLLK